MLNDYTDVSQITGPRHVGSAAAVRNLRSGRLRASQEFDTGIKLGIKHRALRD
jgi:hypothetical protein